MSIELQILFIIVASLFSGLLGVIVSTFFYWRSENRKIKQSVFRHIVSNRYHLTNPALYGFNKDFFSALNEVSVIFNRNKKVIEALRRYHDELKSDRMIYNLLVLVREMAIELKIPMDVLDDYYFIHPFIPLSIDRQSAGT